MFCVHWSKSRRMKRTVKWSRSEKRKVFNVASRSEKRRDGTESMPSVSSMRCTLTDKSKHWSLGLGLSCTRPSAQGNAPPKNSLTAFIQRHLLVLRRWVCRLTLFSQKRTGKVEPVSLLPQKVSSSFSWYFPPSRVWQFPWYMFKLWFSIVVLIKVVSPWPLYRWKEI